MHMNHSSPKKLVSSVLWSKWEIYFTSRPDCQFFISYYSVFECRYTIRICNLNHQQESWILRSRLNNSWGSECVRLVTILKIDDWYSLFIKKLLLSIAQQSSSCISAYLWFPCLVYCLKINEACFAYREYNCYGNLKQRDGRAQSRLAKRPGQRGELSSDHSTGPD